ncbi:MAG: cytochrome c [Lysobacterales bacterium]|nr:MAG: cytochrome c [Xanthomonadales bacterium]
MRSMRMRTAGLRLPTLWPWLVALALLIVLALWGRSAAGQTERGSEIIERALTLEPDLKRGAALYREHCASCHGRRRMAIREQSCRRLQVR